MHLKIQKSLFAKALSICAKAISQSVPTPILQGVKIEVLEDKLVFLASNGVLSIKHEVLNGDDLTIIETGEIVLNYHYLNTIVSKLKDSLVELELVDGQLIKLTNDKTIINITGEKAFNYPALIFESNQNFFKINGQLFNDIYSEIAFIVREDNVKPAFTGINLVAKEGKLSAIATDSIRVGVDEFSIGLPVEFNIVVKLKPFSEIKNLVTNEEDSEIEMAIDENRLFVRKNNTLIQTQLVEDKFPDVTNIVNQKMAYEFSIDNRELQGAIARASFTRENSKNILHLTLKENTLTITTDNQNIGSFKEELAISGYSGKEMTIGCDDNFLSQALRSFNGEIKIHVDSELKPIIIKTAGSYLTHVISPSRI